MLRVLAERKKLKAKERKNQNKNTIYKKKLKKHVN